MSSAVEWRSEAARAAGLTDLVERSRYEWTSGAGVPAASQRVCFRSADDAELVAAFARVAEGSLDAGTQRDLVDMDVTEHARRELDFYLACPGERAWWRLAETVDRQLIGFAIPSATPHRRNVGYLGVVPERRGQGYVHDILGEITRLHAADGVDRITATTDAANHPMVAAFDRAGYAVTEVRLVFASGGADVGDHADDDTPPL